MHLDDAKDKIDLKKTITTYDRRYNGKVENFMDLYFLKHNITNLKLTL